MNNKQAVNPHTGEWELTEDYEIRRVLASHEVNKSSFYFTTFEAARTKAIIWLRDTIRKYTQRLDYFEKWEQPKTLYMVGHEIKTVEVLSFSKWEHQYIEADTNNVRYTDSWTFYTFSKEEAEAEYKKRLTERVSHLEENLSEAKQELEGMGDKL